MKNWGCEERPMNKQQFIEYHTEGVKHFQKHSPANYSHLPKSLQDQMNTGAKQLLNWHRSQLSTAGIFI